MKQLSFIWFWFWFLPGSCLTAWEGETSGRLVRGELLHTGTSQGKPYITLLDTASYRKLHILCDAKSIQTLGKQLSTGKKHLQVSLRAKQVEKTSPLLECLTIPQIRNSTELAKIGIPERTVIGQVMDADVDSGLLAIQSARQKFYLKVSPERAKEIKAKLESLERVDIHENFTYDRNLGHYIGSGEKD